jgi:hypothetical protein
MIGDDLLVVDLDVVGAKPAARNYRASSQTH